MFGPNIRFLTLFSWLEGSIIPLNYSRAVDRVVKISAGRSRLVGGHDATALDFSRVTIDTDGVLIPRDSGSRFRMASFDD